MNREIVEYIVIYHNRLQELVEIVNEYISNGYQPIWGISEHGNYVQGKAQAMVKYAPLPAEKE